LSTESGQKEVILTLDEVRRILTAPNNVVLFITVNVDKLTSQIDDVYGPWKIFETLENEPKTRLHVTHDCELMNRQEDIPIQGCLIGVSDKEYTHLSQFIFCPVNDENPDLPALLVCLQYFMQTKGPMWKQICGKGFSYQVDLLFDTDRPVLELMFPQCTNVIASYQEAKEVVKSHVNEKNWEQYLIDAAKWDLVHRLVNWTLGIDPCGFVCSHFRNEPLDSNVQMVKRIQDVTIDDLQRVTTKYLQDLFDPKQCKTIILCNPANVSEIAEAFKSFGHDLKVYASLEDSYINDE